METKDELNLMKDMDLDTLGKEIYEHILYNILFQIPVIGPRLLKPMYIKFLSSAEQAAQSMRNITGIDFVVISLCDHNYYAKTVILI